MNNAPPPPPVPMSLLARVLLTFVLVLGLLAYAWKAQEPQASQGRPPATLTEAGKTITLNDYSAELWQKDVKLSDDKPLILFVYTSWCPYCHKMFPLVNALAAEAKDMNVIAVSIDRDRAALANYLATQQPLALMPRTITDPYQQLDFIEALQAEQLRYQGSIPFLAVFYQGKPIAEVPGALEKAELDSMVSDIRAQISAAQQP